MIVNFNNGVPPEEERDIIESQIKQKWSGSSNSGKFILAFNDSADTAASIEPVQLSEASAQYEFLSRESQQKVLVGHRITSPMLFGVKDQTGLGNNADEIKTAFQLFDNSVIRPKQEQVIAALDKILAYNGISLNLYFKTLTPIEFTDTENVKSAEVLEEETGVKMSACTHDMPEGYDSIADELVALGEEVDESIWELVDERDVDYDQEEALDKMMGFASTGTARPNANSEQDGQNVEGVQFLVRYKYEGSTSPQREFCRKMMAANKLYRKEDIIQMDNQVVNEGFGPNGTDTYSIWLYKGGARCKHKWIRRTYMSRGGVRPDVNSPNAETISTTKARGKGFRPEANDPHVAVTPSNMKNKGFINPPSSKDIQSGI